MAVLSTSTLPVLLLELDRTVLWLNDASKALLKDSLVSLKNGRLFVHPRELQADFDDFLYNGDADPKTWLLRGEAADVSLIFRLRLIRLGVEAWGSLLTIHRPMDATAQLPDLRPVFGLTQAEMRVVERIASGMTADEVAGHHGITLETARTHIRRAYNKMAVSSREKLIAKVNRYRVP